MRGYHNVHLTVP
ncbi:hypothetical protein F383_23453 [Gossypium arboreum]|uniref:Uncharacterized protein n=1 Tax=Gossypium arboreum TaxID=29729 RepID=A0A0B0P2R9_GOSAR|nr:hypothetical protein F383_23147 [Gossypium arboreum]KHG18429.1 hypothetical protein F383_23453 [Gossypium arboreum]